MRSVILIDPKSECHGRVVGAWGNPQISVLEPLQHFFGGTTREVVKAIDFLSESVKWMTMLDNPAIGWLMRITRVEC